MKSHILAMNAFTFTKKNRVVLLNNFFNSHCIQKIIIIKDFIVFSFVVQQLSFQIGELLFIHYVKE